jgi:IPT/TIG domain-containing protein
MKVISVLWLTVLCVGCGGYGSSTKVTPPQPGAVPAIAQLAPNTVTAGAPGFTLTVNGSNFAGNSVVNWGSATPSTTFVTGKQLMTAIPASMITTAGTVSVTVTNPGTPGGQYGGGTMAETSNIMTFTIK